MIINFNYLQRRLFPSIINALKLVGLLFFETINADHINQLGHQINRSFTLGDGELLKAFSTLKVLDYREGIIREQDKKERSLASILVRK